MAEQAILTYADSTIDIKGNIAVKAKQPPGLPNLTCFRELKHHCCRLRQGVWVKALSAPTSPSPWR